MDNGQPKTGRDEGADDRLSTGSDQAQAALFAKFLYSRRFWIFRFFFGDFFFLCVFDELIAWTFRNKLKMGLTKKDMNGKQNTSKYIAENHIHINRITGRAHEEWQMF